MNGQPRINTIWVVICTDRDGTEGVPCIEGDHGRLMPLYTSNALNVAKISVYGKRVASEHGRACVLAKFTTREDLETFPA